MLVVATVVALVMVVGLHMLDVVSVQVLVPNVVLQTCIAPASVANQADENGANKVWLSASQS